MDFVWFDEEPPADIYTEGLTRTNVGASPVWLTFTPLQGVSTVVKRFLHEKSEDRHKVVMTIDDVEHYNEDEKTKIFSLRRKILRVCIENVFMEPVATAFGLPGFPG